MTLSDNRLRRPLTFIIGLAVIALVAFAFFYPDASQGNTLRQHDMQQGIAIGQETKAYAEATGETSRWTNSLFSGMPTFQISPSYPSTRLYSWINTAMGLGLPSPSSLLAMMMTGFFIMAIAMRMRWYVALTGAIAYGFSTYFIIIIGAGHIWKFITLAYIPPTIAGVMLCYRGRYLAGAALAALFAMMQIAGNHVQMTYYFLFVILGLVIAYLVIAIRKHGMPQWLKATGALAGAALLAVCANLPGLYNTYEYSKETIRGRHSELTSATPGNQQATAGLDKDYITQYSYQPSETFSLFIPNIKGGASARPTGGQMTAMNLAETDAAKGAIQSGEIDAMQGQYLSFLSQYFGDPEGTNGPVYVGALIFALFIVGCVIVRGPVKWALLVLTIFSIVLAWGRHAMTFTDLMLSIAPMYSKFRTVESILVIAEFTMPLLGVMALQKIFTATSDERKAWLKPLCWCFGATALFCVLAWVAPGIFGSAISENDRMIDQYLTSSLMQQGYDRQTASQFSLSNPTIYATVENLRYGMVKADALRSLLVVAAGFVLLFFYLKGKMNAFATAALVCAVVVADLYTVNKRYLSHDSFAPQQITVGPLVAKTAADDVILRDTTMNFRVMDIPRFYSADPSFYHKMIGGYHAAKLTRYQDLIDRHLAAFTRGEQTDADWNVLNMLNARYVVGMDGSPLYNPEALGNAWFVDRVAYAATPDDEMAALSSLDLRREAVAGRQFADILGQAAPGDSTDMIVETSYAPNRLTYRTKASSDRLAVFSEVYFPWGWKATVDGTEVPLGRVNYVLRAMRVPAGEHTVEMTFDPQSIHTTDGVATASVIAIYILVIAAMAMGVRRWKGGTAAPKDA